MKGLVALMLILTCFKIDGAAQEPSSAIFQVILEPIQRTEVHAEINTRVIYAPKKLGDTFHEGELLIQLDNNMFKANYNKAKKVVEKAEADLEAKQQLYEQKLLSLLELKEVEANLATAQADLAQAEKSLSATEIRAGYRGKISSVMIRPYEITNEDRVMLEYLNDEVLVAKFLIPGPLLQQIQLGTPVYFYIQDSNDIVASKITRIGPAINPTSGTVKVEAEIDNSQERWKSGMTCYASFNRRALLLRYPTAFEIPKTSSGGNP